MRIPENASSSRRASGRGNRCSGWSRPEQSEDAVDAAALDALRALFEALTGAPPRTLRAYRDDDALLLLLRYEDSCDRPAGRDRADGTPALVAEAVAQRTGRHLVSGGVSLCAPKDARGARLQRCSEETAGAGGLRLAG